MFKKIKIYLVDIIILIHNRCSVELPLLLQKLVSKNNNKRNAGNGVRCLILPCDLTEPTGSMGDFAMLTALIQALAVRQPGSTFSLVGTYAHQIYIAQVGWVTVTPAWSGIKGTMAFDRLLIQHDAFYALGADVMDGKYGASLVCRLVSYCNHAARLSIPATIIGFSFNSTPRLPAVYALARVHPAVNINVRDAWSAERFSSAVKHDARLCADIAFLLEPDDTAGKDAEAWIDAMRQEGRILVGVNLSTHAFSKVINKSGVESFIADVAQQLVSLGLKRRIAYMLIPHDIKKRAGDVALLKSLHDALLSVGYLQSFYFEPDSPARIKTLVGLLDLVLTGRMHLAIAALGMGTPTLCVAYQSKFEGLYEHFNLSTSDLLHAETLQISGLGEHIKVALNSRMLNTTKILNRVPSVIKLAELNLIN